MKTKQNKAFTLVEMLVVIVIILVLAGLLMKVAALAIRKSAVARAEYELQQIQHALSEFYAEYGHYPPCNGVTYEYEASYTNYQTEWFRKTYLPAHNNPSDPDSFFADKHRPAGEYLHGKEGALGYRYGLVSYLRKRHLGSQPHAYDRDTTRDVDAKASWWHFIDDVGWSGGEAAHPSPPLIGSQAPYTNATMTIVDPWGRSLNYVSTPPYQRYKLWSVGPDGQNGTADDLHAQTQ